MAVVIIVPGFAGNELYAAPSFLPKFKVWLDYASLIAQGWRLLGLAPDGVSPQLSFAPPLVPGPAISNYYDPLCQRLQFLGWQVVVCILDWRGQMDRDAVRVAQTIQAHSALGPARIVTHSRGGLVARRALALLDAAGYNQTGSRLVAMGCPTAGSLSAAMLLNGTERQKRLMYLLLELAPGILAGGFPRGALNAIIGTWPSPYELLPSPNATWLPAAQVAAVYDPARWVNGGYPISTAWLAAARQTWLGLPAIPAGVDWIDAVGYGINTPANFGTATIVPATSAAEYSLDGDGAVLEVAARVPGRHAIRTPTGHQSMPQDGRLIEVIHQVLLSGLNADYTIEGMPLQ